MDYIYTVDDLPAGTTEYGAGGTMTADVEFTYDNRRRLTHEVRERFDGAGVPVGKDFDLAYEYDAGGNRTVKVDAVNDLRTEYHYDLASPGTYASNNNRLERYEVYDISGQTQALLSTTWYYYTREWNQTYADIGNVTRIVTKPEASTQYSAVRFGYAANDRTLTFVVGETWEWNGQAGSCPTAYDVTFAREFHYDGARARYLNRSLNPSALMQGDFVSLSDTWTDYDGDSAYGDFEVTPGYPPTVTNRRSYEPGLAQVDPWMSSGGTATDYMMTDHLGTTRGLIAPNNIPTDAAVYTAFGERIWGTNHRFGYIGSFGYQASGEYPFLHVGARYYDPATGRFLQRDPIGIRGGRNVYAYARMSPAAFIDPEGLTVVDDITAGGAVGGAVGGVIGGVVGGVVGGAAGGVGAAPGAAGGTITGGGAGAVVGGMCGLFYWLGRGIADYWEPIAEKGGYDGINNPRPPNPNPPPFWCFVEGTPIAEENELIAVEKIVKGMEVLTFNPNGECTLVTAVHRGVSNHIIEIDLGSEQLRVTPEHPFWVIGQGWVRAGSLQPGGLLESADGSHVEILDIRHEQLATPVPVYNLTVEGEHVYFVGVHRVRVHNKPP